MREDFDYTCECGYYECDSCGRVWYPMEMDNMQYGTPVCPECLASCVFHDNEKD